MINRLDIHVPFVHAMYVWCCLSRIQIINLEPLSLVPAPVRAPTPPTIPLLCLDQDLMPTLNRAGTGQVLCRSDVQSARYRVVSFVVTCPHLLQSITSVVKYTKLRVSKRTILLAVVRLEVFIQHTWETPPSTSLHLKH